MAKLRFISIKELLELFRSLKIKAKILKNPQQNQTIGEYEFFANMPYLETIKSSSFTTIYKIPRKNFLQLLKNYPEEYVKNPDFPI